MRPFTLSATAKKVLGSAGITNSELRVLRRAYGESLDVGVEGGEVRVNIIYHMNVQPGTLEQDARELLGIKRLRGVEKTPEGYSGKYRSLRVSLKIDKRW